MSDETNDGNEQPVVLPIESMLDLHSFRPKEVREVVQEYLAAATEAGFDQVRLIHGKGLGVLKRTLHSLLSAHPLVESFGDDPSAGGNWGATVVQLKRPSQR